MGNGGSPSLGNVCALKRTVGVSMLERRNPQPPKPRIITPTKLQAQTHDNVITENVSLPVQTQPAEKCL